MNGHQSADVFAKTLQKLDFEDRVTYIKERFNKVVLISNLNVPDQLLTWVLAKREKRVEIAFGSQGKASREQVALMDVTLDRSGVKVKTPSSLAGVLPAFNSVIAYTGHLDDDAELVTWDDENEQFIFNPLADCSGEKIIGKILEHEIPVNYPLDTAASYEKNIDLPLHLTRGKIAK